MFFIRDIQIPKTKLANFRNKFRYDWISYEVKLVRSDSDRRTWNYIDKGDCELDHDVDIFDMLLILKWIADNPPPSPGNQQHAGDLDDDGDCDIYDLVALLDKLNG